MDASFHWGWENKSGPCKNASYPFESKSLNLSFRCEKIKRQLYLDRLMVYYLLLSQNIY
jgi:hypothetical protein